MKDSRILIVDTLRGLAALTVVWFHVTNTYSEDSLVRISGSYGWLGVEVFFVISGFVIPYSMYLGKYKLTEDWWKFLSKRLIRIEPPYFFAIFLSLILWYLSSMAPGFQGGEFDVSVMQLGLHVGYLNDIFGYPWLNPVFWTLALEFQFYLLILLALPVVSHKKVTIRVFGIILLALLVFVFPLPTFVFKYLCLFLLGILVFQYRVNITYPTEFFLLFIMVSTLLYLAMGQEVMIVGVFTAILIAFVNIKPWRIFSYFGAISYSLYLVHVPIGGRVVNLGKRWANNDLEYLFISLLAVVASIVVAHLVYRFIERPMQSWSSRIRYKKN